MGMPLRVVNQTVTKKKKGISKIKIKKYSNSIQLSII